MSSRCHSRTGIGEKIPPERRFRERRGGKAIDEITIVIQVELLTSEPEKLKKKKIKMKEEGIH